MAPPRLPRSPLQRQVVARGVTPLNGGGRSAVVAAEPRQPTATRRSAQRIEAWSFASDGDIIVSGVSDPYEILIGGRYLDVIANLTAALTGDTDIDILVNGAVADTVTIASGATREAVTLALALEPEDIVTLESTAVGAGSARCTVQMKVES